MPGPVGARGRLADALVAAVVSGGSTLATMRAYLAGLDPATNLRRMVVYAVDPELLVAVLGDRLAARWVQPLRAQYQRFQLSYPADWADVEKAWRQQRARWMPAAAGSAGGAAAATGPHALHRGYPEQDPADVSPLPSRGGPPRRVRPRPVHGRRGAAPPGVRGVPLAPRSSVSGVLLDGAQAPAGPAADPALLDPPEAAALADAEQALATAEPARPPGGSCGVRGPSTASRVGSGPAVGAAALLPPPPAAPLQGASSASVSPSPVATAPPPLLLERMLDAILTSYSALEAVRSFFLEADGTVYGWSSLAIPPHVSDRLAQRLRERAVSAVR